MHPGTGLVQVHWCVTGFCSTGMVAILTFCLQVQCVLYCLSSGILVCAYLHPYPLKGLEGAAILTLACRFRVHDALYCAPVFVSMYLHASRYWYGAGTLVRNWFL